jgi:glutathione S-transferase
MDLVLIIALSITLAKFYKMKLRLIYPDVPFWRAETSRIALFYGGIEFEDVRPSREEISKMKIDGTFPFGQFPVLQVDGITLAQTGAMARFCGKLSGLYPINDDFAAAKVDEVIDLATDINNRLMPALREKDPKLRLELRQELSGDILPRWLGFLEKLLADNGDTGYFVGDSFSVADLAIWRLCGWISSGIIDGLSVNLFDSLPLLNKHQKIISNLPKVAEWVEKHQKG